MNTQNVGICNLIGTLSVTSHSLRPPHMTPFNSTPIIWIAFGNGSEGESFAARIRDFAEARTVGNSEGAPSEFLNENGKHQSAWLVVDEEMSNNPKLQELAKEASEMHDFFKCMIVGGSTAHWPEGSITLPPSELSTAIIDRLRNEIHVLRISISRLRHMRRLQGR